MVMGHFASDGHPSSSICWGSDGSRSEQLESPIAIRDAKFPRMPGGCGNIASHPFFRSASRLTRATQLRPFPLTEKACGENRAVGRTARRRAVGYKKPSMNC